MATAGIPEPNAPGDPFDARTAATVVLDRHGAVLAWNDAARTAYGFTAEEVRDGAVQEILFDSESDWPSLLIAAEPPGPFTQAYSLRHRDGGTVRTLLHASPLESPGAGLVWLVTLVPEARLKHWVTDQAMLHGLFTQSPIVLTVYGPDGRVSWVNAALDAQMGTPEEWVGKHVRDMLPGGEVLSPTHPDSLENAVEEVLLTGKPLFDVHFRSPLRGDPTHQRVWSCSYFRLEDGQGHTLGVCESAFDITERYEAHRRLALLSRASTIGLSLNVEQTAEDLAALVVPEFSDSARVEVAEWVLAGDQPSAAVAELPRTMRTIAERAADSAAALPSYTPANAGSWMRLTLPLRAGAALLGRVTFLRTAFRDPFDEADRALAAELVSHTAVSIDNAHRYARERKTALTLQRTLLPPALPAPTGVEVAHYYAPAAGPMGVGGDWYDVIPLSGARVGLVVGDVVGHGVNAAATMGRLRTTVSALAALDLDPGELLMRLDDLVAQARIGIHPVQPVAEEDPATGARCLYAVYDPASGRCSLASAGHLPPVVARPDGTPEPLAMAVGPPLGLGGLPFEVTELDLPEGSVLALFTDGLVQQGDGDPMAGVTDVCQVLRQEKLPLSHACEQIASRTASTGPARDDAALLLVRVHTLADQAMVSWAIPPDPAEVAGARRQVSHQLTRWGLDEVAFVVELVVSELVTNAIRYGGAPVRLRLLWDQYHTLICEVSDGGHTSPHLRRAGLFDEGGRGLFLVAQFTDRWGTRYTADGKTIWAEVPLATPVLDVVASMFE
ncbi:SpoIIE family protein phosphatase [Streptomyces sp. NPDC047061]|uniref:SpoIIE family protein phosphatase n=1 Tax=Streptomyces sp. NPDC047061 TaxID=3154605 RepID=UPI0033CDC487